ncbi:hypothetical protein KP509_20G055000 [Ceratopteris richardii]|uniref:Uncharacterized protein n=1 Tax=Ceratopteris richardii TaxID=49495 RepID=A0A8T2SHC4_CERRI|nr:hypothetical protein KP509_20G055000 [Ceratopteris richardii]
METLFASQLQQDWLEKQPFKQSSAFLASNGSIVSISSHQNFPASLAFPPSPPDSATEVSTTSDPSQVLLQNLDEEGFGDPILRCINDMLMNEEDLNDRNCMMFECTSQMRELYEILGSSEGPPACENHKEEFPFDSLPIDAYDTESSALTSTDTRSSFLDFLPYETDNYMNVSFFGEDSDYGFSAYGNSANASVFSQDDGLCGLTAQTPVVTPLWSLQNLESRQIIPAPSGNVRNRDNRVDELINNINAINSNTSRSASQSLLGRQEPLNSTNASLPSSALGSSMRKNFSLVIDNQHLPVGSNEHNHMLRPAIHDVGWNNIKSDSMPYMTSGKLQINKAEARANGRSKRPAAEIDTVTVSPGISSSSSADNGDAEHAGEEENLSYVRNQDLDAEMCGKVLNSGLAVLIGMLSKSSSACVKKDTGRTTIVVSTVADLKGLLMSCAQAVASSNLQRAQEILREIRQDANPYGSGLQRLAHYFAEGLVARLSGTGDRLYSVFMNNGPSAAKLLKAHHLYVEVCPFVKVSHYFANKAILDAAKGASRLHIIDYGILYGLQWPCLISALAIREGGPPVLRITGIDFPQPGYDHAERVEMTGRRLSEYARTYNVPFEYHAVASRWETIQPSSLLLSSRWDEVVIVNSMHRLHHLLDETVPPLNPRKTVLSRIREINPKIFVQGIKNGNYNVPFFMSRFKEALISFSGHFDMFETLIRSDNQERLMIEREVLGRDILNIIACEGAERIERPETYKQWQNRTQRAGFVQMPVDRNVLKDTQAIVGCKYNKNFTVDEDRSWMLLSWKGKVANALSVWKPC